jgi:mRNA interferase MazF
MTRTRVSTSVDADLLADARRTRDGGTDAGLIDDALSALLARHRSAEIDEAYATTYAAHPLDEADEARDVAIPRMRRALVAPCTTTVRGLPSEVVLEPGDDPIGHRSAVNLDSVESVSVGVLVERLGTLSGIRMSEICAALAVATDHG